MCSLNCHARESGVLELPRRTYPAVVGFVAPLNAVGAVIQTRNAAPPLEKRQRDGETLVVLEFKNARQVVVVEKGDEPHLRVGVVFAADVRVMPVNLAGSRRSPKRKRC